ncbi:hypothetical protein SeMB42_g01051 [Synchytrium endobioticum]|uniref:Zn(2)-C6 fungal-type domain-containing protein n=1 Tax=Synchytrium endobioticum TaxID=286115 RepID=A0A507DMW4_9FUNG|nr:hypothetical protein SeMB42_g01051 [Synchytrium endobioticum]
MDLRSLLNHHDCGSSSSPCSSSSSDECGSGTSDGSRNETTSAQQYEQRRERQIPPQTHVTMIISPHPYTLPPLFHPTDYRHPNITPPFPAAGGTFPYNPFIHPRPISGMYATSTFDSGNVASPGAASSRTSARQYDSYTSGSSSSQPTSAPARCTASYSAEKSSETPLYATSYSRTRYEYAATAHSQVCAQSNSGSPPSCLNGGSIYSDLYPHMEGDHIQPCLHPQAMNRTHDPAAYVSRIGTGLYGTVDSAILPSASAKRPRTIQACNHCRLKKLRCDGLLPCASCIKAERLALCVYAPESRARRGRKPSPPLTNDAPPITKHGSPQ